MFVFLFTKLVSFDGLGSIFRNDQYIAKLVCLVKE